MAMRHLHQLGHRRIAVVRGPEELFDSEPRWAGICSAVAEAGIEIDERLTFQLPGVGDPTSGFEGGLDIVRQMLATGHEFTAVLAFDDLTALGVVRGLREAGLRVPEDCSVLGFDDVLIASTSNPPLTTIHQPCRDIAVIAFRTMLDRLADPALPTRRISLPPRLVVRESCGAYLPRPKQPVTAERDVKGH